jgi:hypothetical protein
MNKEAAVTVRLPLALKRRIEARAKRERRSLSAQVVWELEQALASEPKPEAPRPALGMFAGGRVPTDEEIAEVRALLWGRMGRRGG